MYTAAIQVQFSSAHHHPGARPECGRIHGHNYRLEVIMAAEKLKQDMVMDFDTLRRTAREVIGPWDHQLLNELDDFRDLAPTTENIARLIFEKMRRRLGPDAPLLREVVVWEKEGSRASYREERRKR